MSILLTWKKSTEINCIVLEEKTSEGQAVAAGHIEIVNSKGIKQQIPFTTIGRKRIITFPSVLAASIKIVIDESKRPALISDVAVYKIDDSLVEH